MQISFSEYYCKYLGRCHFQSTIVRVYADIIFRVLLEGFRQISFQSTIVRVYADIIFRVLL